MKKANQRRKFGLRCGEALSICFFPVLVCNFLTMHYTNMALWGFIVAPAVMVLTWYNMDTHHE